MAARLEDWVAEMADHVIAAAERRHLPVVVASGLSPSGPVHLGNLREVMTPHLVADEIRRRGIPVRHLLSWDDFDRLRKVPAGVDESWAVHVGKPLSRVPPPPDSEHVTWAEHFKAPMIAALEHLGIDVDPISQTVMYTGGAYLEHIVAALRARRTIDAILSPFRTRQSEVDVAEGGATDDEEHDEGAARSEYFPYRPYCSACGRDTTNVTAYDEAYSIDYECACGNRTVSDLRDDHDGKLVWKVDWPMRWAFEQVVFEPSGVDHQSPGSSFEVGKPIVEQVFGSERPLGPMYAFVGAAGMAKMSSSKGQVPTPIDALQVTEPQVLRWQYARRRPRQAFDVGFGQELLRLYDEWDASNRKVAAGTAAGHEKAATIRASATVNGPLPATPRPLPFRTLASVVDITAADPTQLLRVLSTLDGEAASLERFEPRLSMARRWVELYVSTEDRTTVRSKPDFATLTALGESERDLLRELVERFDDNWSLDELTRIVYGVPKLGLGLPIDAPADDAVRIAQREFFKLVYRLTVDDETGPRLPTLLLAIGRDQARRLLTA